MERVHLICNAHLDPVWQWEWQEGAAAAVSTFRTAASLCEESEYLIFNHNEALLYQWVEEYEPALFEKIRMLVKKGRWHIAGGWYLQPDCNMPCGESFIRQILAGNRYFKEKFGVQPSTAVNFDSFGHSRGLVQILKKSGYDSYLFMRPDENQLQLPAGDFVWVGYDGSRVTAHRVEDGYNSPLGRADEKIIRFLKKKNGKLPGLIAWGVGDHGGGPSRQDVEKIDTLIKNGGDPEILHSTPERFFSDLRQSGASLPEVGKSLNPCFTGCYTSQIRIKQKHRRLENALYRAEKMSSCAALQTGLSYPAEELQSAARDLLMSEFHDVLCGTCVQPVEEYALGLLGHGLETVSKVDTRSFFALSSGQKKAENGEIPILIYNPHPCKVRGVFECEFMLQDQNWKEEFSFPEVYQNGKMIASQPEKELGNVHLDWRKRVVFEAELEPSCMNRFDCRIKILKHKPIPQLQPADNKITFETGEMKVVVNCRTGLMDQYRVKGIDFLSPGAFLPMVMDDNGDPWRMDTTKFNTPCGRFELMSRKEGSRYSGVNGEIESVRVVEDGEVRSVVEAVMKYGDSFLCIRYLLPKKGTEIEVQVRVNWNEKKKMLKLLVPTLLKHSSYKGQTAYGVEELPAGQEEVVAQKWVGVFSRNENLALTCVNDGIYGSSYDEGAFFLSILRSPGYCAHPIEGRELMPQDRFSPFIEQGERSYTFWLNAGTEEERTEHIDREALAHNEKPYVLSLFPSGEGKMPLPAITLSDGAVNMTAFKQAENSDGFIIRLYEPTGKARQTTVTLQHCGFRKKISLMPFEIRSLRFRPGSGKLEEVDLLENKAEQ